MLAAQEAVDIRRELAAQRPDVFRPDLAGSLNNLSNTLSGLGQREPASLAAQEAVDLYRELAAQRHEMFRPGLAMSLNNLANRLRELGQHEPALLAAQEAVDIRRELAAQRSDMFRPGLAMSLSNLATMLSELGQREPALLAAREAVATLSPEFLRHQSAHEGLIRTMRLIYLQLCESAGQEPDLELLEPLQPYFGGTN